MLTLNPLIESLTSQIQHGLLRKSATSRSRWAELYRVMPIVPGLTTEQTNLSFRYYPWTKDMHDEPKPWCGPKAAQMGYTETGLDIALFNIDVLGQSVLYLLPKKAPDATDFSKDRFDSAIQLSPHLSKLFTDVNNVGHKKAGHASLYIRGMRSRSGVKSVPVGTVIFDEYDEMPKDNVAQAMQRMSGKVAKQWIRYSTPTMPDFGIDLVYKFSTQDHFFFKCPSCSRRTELSFPEDLIVTGDSLHDPSLKQSHYRCNLCHAKLPHESKLDWLSLSNTSWESTGDRHADERGFYINQFYSFTVSPYEIARKVIMAQSDPSEEQELYNSIGGKAHAPKGTQLEIHEINAIRGNYSLSSPFKLEDSKVITMGVDIGNAIHYHIDQWFLPTNPGFDPNANAFRKTIRLGTVLKFEELDILMRSFQILMCVVDHNPERRKSEEFAARFSGYVKLCYYPEGIEGKSINESKKNDAVIGVDRTSWLDMIMNRVRNKKMLLPGDVPEEYKNHLRSLVRRYEVDKHGNKKARYWNRGPDHYAHANVYSEIALPLVLRVAA